MFQGPYNTPRPLGSAPFAAVFWPLLAPILFVNIIVLAARVAAFDWAFGPVDEGGSLRVQWTILLVAHASLFAAMSLWSERVGAGPFAGSLLLDGDWLAISALTGPVVLLGTTLLTGLLVGGDDPNWMFREAPVLDLLGPGAIGLSMVAAAVFVIPIAEEIAFRGVALGFLLSRGLPPLVAGLVTAAVFAATHQQYNLFGMLPIFIMGLYLAWLRVVTGSIAAPIIAHMAANGVSTAIFIGANPA
ncbi:MAG: CPBP family intramembrane glutamic endopeptidase [Pseudomonadota bacterium]